MRRITICGRVAAVLLGFAISAWTFHAYAQARPGTEREVPKALMDELRAVRKDLETLKEGQKTLTRELRELKEKLHEDAEGESEKSREVVVGADDDPFKGERDAKVTIIEFSDYQCPFCARFSRETLPKIEQEYIQTGKVRYVFRDFPIVSIHKEAIKAAEAANCAGDQKRYWEMHDRLFANQKQLKPEDLPKHAEALGMNRAAFETCLKSGKYFREVQADLRDGLRAGVKSTPTLFLGLTEKSNTITAAAIVEGAQPYAAFKEAIDALLNAPQK
jgi:protein-disulfide isomerase